MLIRIFCISLFASVVLANDEFALRIFQGRDVRITNFPWIAKIVSYRFDLTGPSWDQKCTGTYIHPWWVLTAATCVVKDRMTSPPEVYYLVEVFMGMEESQNIYPQKRGVDKYFIKPEYINQPRGSPRIYGHNLALLRLNEKFETNNRVQVHTKWSGGGGRKGCRSCIAGFGFGKGTTFARVLQVSDIRNFRQDVVHIKNRAKDVFVTRKHHLCYGDIGGPLYQDKAQVGVASRYIHKPFLPKSCGNGRFVNIANRTTRDWIIKTLRRS
ncbi:CLIPB15 [Trypoxylus dichotomus]